jgi:hypothetical protein
MRTALSKLRVELRETQIDVRLNVRALYVRETTRRLTTLDQIGLVHWRGAELVWLVAQSIVGVNPSVRDLL